MGLARRIASRIAGPIAQERLTSELARRAKEREVLDDIARLIASADNLDDAYEALGHKISGLIPFERIEIATVDVEAETLTPAYASGTGVSEDEEGVSSPLAGSPVEEAVRTRWPFLFRAQAIEEVGARFPALVPAVEAGLRSFIAAPIVRSDEVIGAISLGSNRLDAHADEHLVMAERVGLQLAGALPSTPAAAEAEPESRELRILNKIGRIVTSSLDLGEVYGLLAEEVRKLLPFDRIVVWTVDLQRENLIASYVLGADASGQEQGRSFPLSSAAAQGVLSARSGATIVEESAGALAGRFPDLLRQAKPGQPAMLLVPLESGDETVGMLSLRSATSTGYTERDVAVAERIGAQITGAVANAQVYLECKQVEEAVREAVEKLDMAVWGSGYGLWDWKIDENEVWWSQRYKELLDYKEQDDAPPEGLGEPVASGGPRSGAEGAHRAPGAQGALRRRVPAAHRLR